jgi:membrane protein
MQYGCQLEDQSTMARMTLPRKLGRRLWLAHLNFQEHEGTLSAAGIAYYVALSFFPLLLVLVAGLSSILQWTQIGQSARKALYDAIANQASPDLAQQVEQSLKVVSDKAPSGGPIGFLVLVISAIAIFAQLDAAFDRIWRLPPDKHASWYQWIQRLVYQRLKSLGMLIAVGGFIILTMISSMILSGVEHALEPRITLGPWFTWASSLWINLVLNLFAFTLVYRVLPKPPIRWWDALRGGFLAAVLWEAGRQALTMYFLHLNYPSAYGIIGSFIAVMLWAYYASLVILFGAEYVRVLSEEWNGQREMPLH